MIQCIRSEQLLRQEPLGCNFGSHPISSGTILSDHLLKGEGCEILPLGEFGDGGVAAAAAAGWGRER